MGTTRRFPYQVAVCVSFILLALIPCGTASRPVTMSCSSLISTPPDSTTGITHLTARCSDGTAVMGLKKLSQLTTLESLVVQIVPGQYYGATDDRADRFDVAGSTGSTAEAGSTGSTADPGSTADAGSTSGTATGSTTTGVTLNGASNEDSDAGDGGGDSINWSDVIGVNGSTPGSTVPWWESTWKPYSPNGSFTLPVEWGALTALSRLQISLGDVYPHFTDVVSFRMHLSLPSQWSSLTNLKVLTIDTEGWALQFSNPPPPSWSSLTALSHLELKNTIAAAFNVSTQHPTTRQLPSSWSRLTNLQCLDLSYFQMQDSPLPDSWSVLTNLTTVKLQGNCLRGSLPESWSTLTLLSHLDLQPALLGTVPGNLSLPAGPSPSPMIKCEASLAGPIPASWSTMEKLQHLQVSYHSLSSTLPSTWESMTALSHLNASHNNISGPLPSSWSSLSRLVALDLSHNDLTCVIPPGWSNLLVNSPEKHASLSHEEDGSICSTTGCPLVVNMSHNMLQGPIPTWPASDPYNLTIVDLSHNHLDVDRNMSSQAPPDDGDNIILYLNDNTATPSGSEAACAGLQIGNTTESDNFFAPAGSSLANGSGIGKVPLQSSNKVGLSRSHSLISTYGCWVLVSFLSLSVW